MIPVVVLTSPKEQSDVIESLQLRVTSSIVKPVNFESFTAAVRSLGSSGCCSTRRPRWLHRIAAAAGAVMGARLRVGR